jgi:fumarate reductase subunit C
MSRNPYVREVPRTTWYMRNNRYIRYMLREVSCVFIGLYAASLTVGLVRLAQGDNEWTHYLNGISSPTGILFSLLAFGFACYHSITWFNVTPKAMRIPRSDDFVPGSAIVSAHYIIWAVVSLVFLLMMGVL